MLNTMCIHTCTVGHHGCNCDYNDYKWREDTGEITEKEKLPITRLYYGGQNTDLSLGFHHVGPIKCQQGTVTRPL